jgi:hypothetical protein
MTWFVRSNTNTLFVSTTSADALDKFIYFTKQEPKSLRSKAVAEYCKGNTSIKVNKYTLRWE